jgi:hypothetical protein
MQFQTPVFLAAPGALLATRRLANARTRRGTLERADHALRGAA